MKTDTAEKIISYIGDRRQATACELVDYLEISPRAVFKQLAGLYKKGKIDKIGRPPKVYYFLKEKKRKKLFYNIPSGLKRIIDSNYLIITPAGEKKVGFNGFVYWCEKNNLAVEKTALEYERVFKKFKVYKKGGLIDGTRKLKDTFEACFVDVLYYLDFYSIERFGKTKLGWLLLYAKQSQNRTLIKELVMTFKKKIDSFIVKRKIEAVGFVPPTVKRDVQFMNELEKNLNLKLPVLSITKIKTPVIVPQKTMAKLVDRIENAQRTFFIDETRKYRNILLCDDAVGSGATINETAKKVLERGLCSGKIYGLAITGSFKGFEVISEV